MNFRNILLGLFLLVSTLGKAQDHRFDPPWNTPPASAVHFTVPGINNVPDLYGDIVDPQLTIFFAGNQFMVVDDLLAAFKKEYPQYQRIFVETLPPGILAKQIQGGSLTLGNLRITHQPDVYTAGKRTITEMKDYFSHTQIYCYNNICLMVPEGNPAKITSLNDLAQEHVRIAMPNPLWEGIGEQIQASYKKAGGEALVNKIMKDKVEKGTTYLTKIHHRESPMRILYGDADVAPVWSSEVVYQKIKGHPVDVVEIPDELNSTATYMAAKLKTAPHPKAADDFLKFMETSTAQQIYQKYGFSIK
ncbi:substrate-binding domain-containing protein [Sphingobacterium faecale]|uniref:Substrate-binding domain-containing protein n=1 Tax=Sphingobacterium faecale TaxID=2803775 RepID=A0ABS1QZK4_9SPHI|nr:substrate-binding domain-containing protein [Sphingobacterium faecale]MBL1407868.1 substrate-binding domain-containing protein [Sphingobacterium faecale]